MGINAVLSEPLFNTLRSIDPLVCQKVLFKSEQRQGRDQIASYLQTVIDELNAGEPIALQAGGDAISLNPPAQLTFEVKAEQEGPTDGPKELSIEFELEWPEDGEDGGELDIG